MSYKEEAMRQLRDNMLFVRSNILNKSQKDTAKLCGVSRDIIWRIENYYEGCNRLEPSTQTVFAICDALKLSLSEMIDIDIRYSEEVIQKLNKEFGGDR